MASVASFEQKNGEAGNNEPATNKNKRFIPNSDYRPVLSPQSIIRIIKIMKIYIFIISLLITQIILINQIQANIQQSKQISCLQMGKVYVGNDFCAPLLD